MAIIYANHLLLKVAKQYNSNNALTNIKEIDKLIYNFIELCNYVTKL